MSNAVGVSERVYSGEWRDKEWEGERERAKKAKREEDREDGVKSLTSICLGAKTWLLWQQVN